MRARRHPHRRRRSHGRHLLRRRRTQRLPRGIPARHRCRNDPPTALSGADHGPHHRGHRLRLPAPRAPRRSTTITSGSRRRGRCAVTAPLSPEPPRREANKTVRDDLADRYVESTRAQPGQEYRGRTAFLRRLTSDIRRLGLSLLIAEDMTLAGWAYGFPVRAREHGGGGSTSPFRRASNSSPRPDMSSRSPRSWYTPTRTTRASPEHFRNGCSPATTPRSGRRWSPRPTPRSATPSCRGDGRTSGRIRRPPDPTALRPSVPSVAAGPGPPHRPAHGRSPRTASPTKAAPNGPTDDHCTAGPGDLRAEAAVTAALP